MDLMWVMFAFFIFVTVLFIILAVAFPEWFGITGKHALEIHKHHSDSLRHPDLEQKKGPGSDENQQT